MENKVICDWCLYPVKSGKTIRCRVCRKKFCRSCLVEFGKEDFICISCSINVLRENTSVLIFNTKDISGKVKIKNPLKQKIEIEENRKDGI